MSNSIRRPPLRGVILHGNHVVGGVDLPSPSECFIQHFNQEYQAAGLRVIPADVFHKDEPTTSPPLPLGGTASSNTSIQSLQSS